jgi:CheY-like chemotaxis protein
VDGFGLVEQIKSKPNLTEAFVLMLTSGEHAGDLARCRDLGISSYLVKPVRREELRRAIKSALASHIAPSAQRPAKVSCITKENTRGDGARVLVVEDNLTNQRVTATMLERAGHRVVLADNGATALALLDREVFDLILMDVQMPGMDGFETTRQIRKSQQRDGTYTPIVAITAHALSGDRERCLQAGMDDYIAKPVKATALLRLVAEFANSMRA